MRPKFEALGFSAEQWDRYQTLSLERADHEMELRSAGSRGLPKEEFEAFVRAATADSFVQMRAVIGDAAYDELQRFQAERSDPGRKTVQALALRLMFSRTPLQDSQVQQLNRILQSGSAKTTGGNANVFSDEVTSEVRKVLGPEQFQRWRQLHGEQQMNHDIAAIGEQVQAAKARTPRR